MGDVEADLAGRLVAADAVTAVELCAALGARPRRSLDLKGLRAALRRVRVRHTGNPDVLAAIGGLYLRVGLLKEAQEALTQVVRLAPDTPRTYAMLGEALLQLGDARRAVVAFDQALESGVDDAVVVQRREEALALIAVQDEYGEDEASFQARELFGREPGTEPSSGPPAVAPDSEDDVPADLYDDVPMTPPPLTLKPKQETRYSVVPAAPTSKPSTRPLNFRRPARAPREVAGETRMRRHDDRREPDEIADEPTPPPEVPKAPRLPAVRTVDPRRDDNEDVEGRADPDPAESRSSPAPTARTASSPPPPPRASSPPPPPSSPVPRSRASPAPPSSSLTAAATYDGTPMSLRSAPLAAVARGAQRRGPSRRSMLVGAAAVLMAAGGLTLGAFRGGFFGSKGTEAERMEIEQALNRLVIESGVSAHAEGRDTLDRARKAFPGDASLAMWDLRLQTLAFLDGGAAPEELRRALGEARSAGYGESHVAFAVVAEDLAQPNTERLQRFKTDAKTTYDGDAFYQLALGALCTRHGEAHAAEYYRLALRIEPQLRSARLRLINELLSEAGSASEGRQLAGELTDDGGDRAEVAALAALSLRAEGDLETYARQLDTAKAGLDRLPVFLRSQVRALSAAHEPDAARAQALLSIAVEEAVTPASASLAGGVALTLGHVAVGQFASQKALEMAPDFEPARALAARAALFSGDLARAEELSHGVSASAGGDLVGMLAYEHFDTFRLGRAVDALPQGATARYTLSSAVARLNAARPLERAELLELSRTDPLWGNLIAVDAALDVGDVALARELASPWEGHPSPLQAIRLGRLLRYEGRPDDAHVIIQNAAKTEHGLMEEMMLSSDKKERQALMDGAPPSSSPARKWLHVLRRAMDKSFPQSLRAAAALETPGPDEALPTRVLCAYALALNSDKVRAKEVLQLVLKVFPAHPDAVAAGVSVGLLPPSALKRGG